MRARPLGPLVAVLAAVVLSACGTAAPSSAPSTTRPATAGRSATTGPLRPNGGTPVDVGRVRLWLPTTWTLAADECPPDAKQLGCLATPCPPGGPDTVNVAGFAAPPGTCRGEVQGGGSVFLFTRRLGSGPATWRRLGGRDAVVVQVPALGVVLYGFSTEGSRIAESFGPSPLVSLAGARLPIAPEPGWRRVAYGALSAEVPPSWPHVDLKGSHDAEPGSCGFSDFETPVVDVGTGPAIAFCPLIDGTTLLRANASPVNAVWLQPPRTGHLDVFGFGRATTTVERRVHGLRLELTYLRALSGSDVVEVTVHHDGRVAELLVGLGRSPRVAEQILSSVELDR